MLAIPGLALRYLGGGRSLRTKLAEIEAWLVGKSASEIRY
jgi:hypothetical protein